MTKLSLHLPTRYRLDLKLVKSREGSLLSDPLLPSLKDIKKIRSGSKISRFFRHIFEHKNIRKILGSNIALAVIATSGIPTGVSANTTSTVGTPSATVIQAETNLATNFTGTQYPVSEVKITQGYRAFHPGIDLDGNTGDEVRPIKSGRVALVQFSRFSYGNAIYIDHGDGVSSLYAHLSKILVKNGDEVSPTTVIGLMGSTGRSTGDHLHLEVRVNGRSVNPSIVLGR